MPSHRTIVYMSNRWGIPAEVEKVVRQRDTKCVYCGVEFSAEKNSRRNKSSWEHMVNDIRLNEVDNIALCCMSCNASKGSKLIKDWLLSSYCIEKGITPATVAQVVKNIISKPCLVLK
ncbi:MAG: hypothetical protein JNM78_05800 [Cyclobacteriaceae bacterium]|nr:hypothetical protein [Cyclobacteriaceae bacterium]